MKKLLSFLLLVCLFPICGCSSDNAFLSAEDMPVTIHDFAVFGQDLYSHTIYIDWENKMKDASVLYLELKIVTMDENGEPIRTGNSGEPSVIFHMDQETPVAPGMHNSEKYIEFNTYSKIDRNYIVSLKRVALDDGRIWNASDDPVNAKASLNGKIRKTGAIRLNEANIYKEYSSSYQNQMNIGWTNTSDSDLIYAVFLVEAVDSDGNVITGDYKPYYITASNDSWAPIAYAHSDANAYIFEVSASSYDFPSGQKRFRVSAVYAVDTAGNVYPDNSGIYADMTLLDKKGYPVCDVSKDKAVQSLQDSLMVSLTENGLETEEPQIAVKESDWITFRFADYDIRAEYANGSKEFDNVSFALYCMSRDFRDETEQQKIYETYKNLIRAVIPVFLPETADESERIDEYLNSDASYIDFEDTSIDTYEDLTMLLEENDNYVYALIFGAGRFTRSPSNTLFWAYDSPYPSQQAETVEHRPQN